MQQRDNVKRVMEALKGILKETSMTVGDAISALRQLDEETLQMAWNYTEVKCERYSFKEALDWIKSNMNEEKHSGATITKEVIGNKILLKCCFLDSNKQPLSKVGDLYLAVETNSICKDLEDSFGDKNMIVVE